VTPGPPHYTPRHLFANTQKATTLETVAYLTYKPPLTPKPKKSYLRHLKKMAKPYRTV